MKSGNFYFFIFILSLSASQVFSQQRMTVKPDNFKPFITNEIINNSPNPEGYFIYPNQVFVTTSFKNIRVFPSGMNQTSPSAALLYSVPVRIFTGANTDIGVGYYYSLNAGSNWTGDDLNPGSSLFSSTPSCIYGNNNRIHYNYNDDFIVSNRSNDYGYSWLGRVIVPSTTQFDMNNNTADITPSSPYYGNVYVAWSNFNVTQPTIYFSSSSNGGATYNTAIQIGSPSANHYEQGCNLQTASNGNVYCFWSTPNLSNNSIEDHIVFSKSVNGGNTWSAPVNAVTINGIRGTIPIFNIRAHSFPSAAIDRSGGARDGFLYLCWSQKNLVPAGSDADICFCYSTNGGTSWSTPIRVNDDPINNGKQQFLPRMTVDQLTGKIGIIYYDNRDFINSDSCFTYMAVSYDGGNSFFNMRVSSASQRPYPLSGYSDGYYSDYNSIVGANDSFYALWTDNRNGPAQIYSSEIILKPYISHTLLKDSENLNGPYPVQSVINTFGTNLASGETKVFWGRGSITDSIVMTNSGNNWSSAITGNGSPALYLYYIKTKDVSGRISALPDNAPVSLFSFQTGADTARPKFFFNPFSSVPKHQWPDTALVKVTDNTGIDSVWIVWYKNNPSAGLNRFKLNSVGDDYFRGIFNSSPAQVSSNDSVFYRIFAQDNSTNHNVDSTSLNKLYISQYYLVRFGNGTTVTSYPYKTYYTDSRTDILYTAAEMNAYGGSIARIMSVGFNVSYASPQMMSNFNFRIKNTSLTSLTGFTSSGWTNVNSFNYTVPGGGWQYVIFQTPFIWDGTSNILIEICFDNTSFNANSSVYASQVNNMVWHQSQDLPGGNGCVDLTGGSAQSFRPNVTFIMNSILGVKESENIIPKEYNLNQNYPNPFNPVTKISFSIPKKEFVTLKIYDILGREITTLVNEVKTPGNYMIDFDGKNLSSGVYFYKLASDNFSDVKRMLLIK